MAVGIVAGPPLRAAHRRKPLHPSGLTTVGNRKRSKRVSGVHNLARRAWLSSPHVLRVLVHIPAVGATVQG
ncbi:hypothetical protein PLANTIT3_60231 [Plantibacter sp. T3]|nr:hypothetical protein PLANTIT3_60231 [Plantibacter sp. T3]